MSDTFTISIGKKRKSGVGRGRILELAAQEKLPLHAFLRPDDHTGNWQEVCTVQWLGHDAQPYVLRHCRDCDTRLDLSESSVAENVTCPDCAAQSTLIDYLSPDDAPIPNVPIEPWGIYDAIAVAFGGICLLLGLCGCTTLIFNPVLSVLLGFILLASGGALFFVTWQHRSEASHYRSHLKNVEQTLKNRTEILSERSARLRSLERGLTKVKDDIINVTNTECQKRIAEAEQNLQVAQENAGTVHRIAERYLDEQRKWWTRKLKGDNFHIQKERIEKAMRFAQKQGYPVPDELEAEILQKLEADYKLVLRKEAEQARQRQIREQIRADQKADREAREAAKRAEEEKRLIREALDEALAAAGAEHSAEVEELQKKLEEAEERGKRAVSQAQLTKVGYVYIISNVGAFGEGVFKVGLTRRLEPLDRVKELGDASVPFPFDVHAMIFSEDAPALEHALHKSLHNFRVNRVNMRKEFFRVDLQKIIEKVERHHGVVEYVADAEALDYRSGLEMSEQEFEFIGTAADDAGIDFESDED